MGIYGVWGKNVFYISVAHNSGILELEKAIVKALRNEAMESLIKAEFNDESLEDF